MLLTITCTGRHAADLGFLLHKHPDNVWERELSHGPARVFCFELQKERCSYALLLDIDPLGLVRGRVGGAEPYVNDRPYVASSFLSVALGDAFRTAMQGRCKDRPEVVSKRLPFEAELAAVACAEEVEKLLIRGEGRRRVHECVFAVLALESEPVDPRL